MTPWNLIRRHALSCVLAVLAATGVQAQTSLRSGFNIFSVSQDTEIGRQSAAQVESQMPMLNDPMADRYVQALGARLAAQAPGPKFDYHFRVTNQSEINAFALPGGYVYVNRGLLANVQDEGELAGVLAHEIAHVALRHPTSQASKAYLAQAGLGVLGGMFGRGGNSTGSIMNSLGGFGLNTLFLKFSRTAESQADVAGTQIMARAGYDPNDMARFFAFLEQQPGGNSGAVATFLSDHPAPADREARVRQEATYFGSYRRVPPIGQLAAVQARLGRATAPDRELPGYGYARGLSIEAPSGRFRTFQQHGGSYSIPMPDNWVVSEDPDGFGATILPRGGVQTTTNDEDNILYGVIINHFVPYEGQLGDNLIDPGQSPFGNSMLEQATTDIVREIQAANPYLQPLPGSDHRMTVDGARSIELTLTGRSPRTRRIERANLVARELGDGHIVYVLMVAPDDEFAALQPTYEHMIRNMRVNDNLAHN